MWPGNTADVTTLIPVIDRLRQRFDVARMCVVAEPHLYDPRARTALQNRRGTGIGEDKRASAA
jgi:hypothetical protein